MKDNKIIIILIIIIMCIIFRKKIIENMKVKSSGDLPSNLIVNIEKELNKKIDDILIKKVDNKPGQVLNTVFLQNIARTGIYYKKTSWRDMVNTYYTPVSEKSYIEVSFQNPHYNIRGYGNDEIRSQMLVNGKIVAYGYQKWTSGSGGGNRSGVLFPLFGVYQNDNKNKVNIKIQLWNRSDDDMIFYNPSTIKIQEYSR